MATIQMSVTEYRKLYRMMKNVVEPQNEPSKYAVMKYVELYAHRGNYLATSMNSFMIMQTRGKYIGDDMVCLLPIIKPFGNGEVTITTRNGKPGYMEVSVTQGDTTITKSVQNRSYIKWETMIRDRSDNPKVTVRLDAKLLRKMIDAFPGQDIILETGGRCDKFVILRGKDGCGGILPMRYESTATMSGFPDRKELRLMGYTPYVPEEGKAI